MHLGCEFIQIPFSYQEFIISMSVTIRHALQGSWFPHMYLILMINTY